MTSTGPSALVVRSLSGRSLYRCLLREVDRQFTAVNQNTMWREEVRQRFRRQREETDPEKIKMYRTDAENMLTFLYSRRRYNELMELYYPPEMEQSEKVARSARRVGLELPKAPAPTS